MNEPTGRDQPVEQWLYRLLIFDSPAPAASPFPRVPRAVGAPPTPRAIAARRGRSRKVDSSTLGPRLTSVAMMLAWLALTVVQSPAAHGQPHPIDPVELQVNSLSTGTQYAGEVALLPDGGFIIVWTSAVSLGSDIDGRAVQMRRLEAAGQAIGAETQVNTMTAGHQLGPGIAVAADDSFYVVWQSDVGSSGPGESLSIFGRAFAPDGVPRQASDLQLNVYTDGLQSNPSVAALPSGDFVVVWSSEGSFGDDTDRSSIQARRVRSDGVPLDASEFQVNVYTTNVQVLPDIDAAADGRFVVTWTSDGSFGSDQSYRSLQARRFAADSTPLDAAEFQVNTQTLAYQERSRVAVAPDGAFVIAWEDQFDPAGDTLLGIKARRFAADGVALDAQDFPVNVYTSSAQTQPAIGTNAAGDFVVSWTSLGSFGSDSDNSIQARRFRSNGSPVDAAEFQVNAYTTNRQASPSVHATAEGDFILAWSSRGSFGDDQDLYSAQARRFGPPRIEVTSTAGVSNGVDCTLLDAVEAANTDSPVGGCPAGSGGGVVVLPEGARIDLQSPAAVPNALPPITSSVTISGPGARIQRDAGLACPVGPEFRIAEVVEGGVLTLEGVTLANGCLTGSDPGGGVLVSGGSLVMRGATIAGNEAGVGGGIAVDGGALYLYDSTVRGNLAGDAGGGLAILAAPDVAWISGSTLSGNAATRGGGLLIGADATLALFNSTLSGNLATAEGGGLLVDAPGAEASIDFTTITDNVAPLGAGLSIAAGAANLYGSLVGDNVDGTDCAASGILDASGANLDTDGSCAALAGGSVTTVASLWLSGLGSHGGPTKTHLPLAGSPALDGAPDCLTSRGSLLVVDQRGLPRPTDDGGGPGAECDLGSVEGGPLFLDGFESGDTAAWSATLP